ncbi:MAG: proline--tRNA ligase [Deltaproteobacteria bacterium]
MYWSRSFIATLKEAPEGAESVSHQLMLRTQMIRPVASGVYAYLPLGWSVLKKIEEIIRAEMQAAGAQEVLLPALQPIELWQRTGRDELMGETMYRFTDRRGRKMSLGPTHEEVVTDIAAHFVRSYRDLLFTLFQIQTKFRDEIRPRFGVVRSCEFIMKDAYSFDRDTAGLDRIYETMRAAYERIFRRCGLAIVTVKADSGVIGGDVSHEFMVPAASGEDVLYRCKVCGAYQSMTEAEISECPHCRDDMDKVNALEVGHIFKLRAKYADVLGVRFLDESGHQQTVQMGCYGIGVSRLIPAVIEQNHDADGIVWPRAVAPIEVALVPVNVADTAVVNAATLLHQQLEEAGISVLLDDRDERAGVKFKDADLLGCPVRVTIGKKWVETKKFEVSARRSRESVLTPGETVVSTIVHLLEGDGGGGQV